MYRTKYLSYDSIEVLTQLPNIWGQVEMKHRRNLENLLFVALKTTEQRIVGKPWERTGKAEWAFTRELAASCNLRYVGWLL
jgi:hypothetical protein